MLSKFVFEPGLRLMREESCQNVFPQRWAEISDERVLNMRFFLNQAHG